MTRAAFSGVPHPYANEVRDYHPRDYWPATKGNEPMRKFGQGESKYLKGSDLEKDGGGYKTPIVAIDTVQVDEVGTEEEGKDERYIIMFVGVRKGLVMNKTNEETLVDLFGPPPSSEISALSEHFHGASVCLYFDPAVKYKGKRIGGLRLRAVPAVPSSASAQAPEEPPPPTEEPAFGDDPSGDDLGF